MLVSVLKNIPKKYHGSIAYLGAAIEVGMEQWVKAEMESEAAHADYRAALDDEWAKIEKAREALLKLEEQYLKALLKFEGVEFGEGEVLHLWREDDMKAMRSFLHEDKHQDPRMKQRAQRLFPKWHVLEEKVLNRVKKSSIPVLESYGWSKTVEERRAKRAKP